VKYSGGKKCHKRGIVEISRGNRAAKIADWTVARGWPLGGRETFISECLIRRISYRLGERWMRALRTKRRRGRGTWRIHLGEFADKVGPPRHCITAPRDLPHDDSKNFYSPYNYG